MKLNNKRAFTLIELLVVISIIAVLMSIMMPALGRAKQVAKRISCGSKLKQLSMTWYLYTQDYNNKLGYCTSMLPSEEKDDYTKVDSWSWGGKKGWAATSSPKTEDRLLYPYIEENIEIFQCPADKGHAGGWGGDKVFESCGNSYGMADSATRGVLGYKITQITRPSDTILCFDATVYNKWADDYYGGQSLYWHPNDGSNMGMIDGSYQTVDREEVEANGAPQNIPGLSWGFLNPKRYNSNAQW